MAGDRPGAPSRLPLAGHHALPATSADAPVLSWGLNLHRFLVTRGCVPGPVPWGSAGGPPHLRAPSSPEPPGRCSHSAPPTPGVPDAPVRPLQPGTGRGQRGAELWLIRLITGPGAPAGSQPGLGHPEGTRVLANRARHPRRGRQGMGLEQPPEQGAHPRSRPRGGALAVGLL